MRILFLLLCVFLFCGFSNHESVMDTNMSEIDKTSDTEDLEIDKNSFNESLEVDVDETSPEVEVETVDINKTMLFVINTDQAIGFICKDFEKRKLICEERQEKSGAESMVC